MLLDASVAIVCVCVFFNLVDEFVETRFNK